MSTEFRSPQGPPWDVDVVADVHAGVYPTEQTADLLERIAADPEGAAILAALDTTVDELSLLPPLTMPDKYVLRLDTAIAAEHRAVPAKTAPARPGGEVLRGGMTALLGPGATPARPGLPRPEAPQRGHRGLPRQVSPHHPEHPPRRSPVIPRVLPHTPQQATAAPSGVTDLSARRAARPAPASPPPPAGPTAPPQRIGDHPGGRGRVGSLQAQRAKRRRWTGGLLAAAAVVAVGTITAISVTSGSGGDEFAGTPEPQPTVTAPSAPGALEPTPDGQALVLEKGRFGDSLDEIEGHEATGGPFADAARQAACLGANGITFNAVTGITEVTYEGQDAYAIAVEDAEAGTTEVLVVGEQCGIDGNSDLLGRQTVSN